MSRPVRLFRNVPWSTLTFAVTIAGGAINCTSAAGIYRVRGSFHNFGTESAGASGAPTARRHRKSIRQTSHLTESAPTLRQPAGRSRRWRSRTASTSSSITPSPPSSSAQLHVGQRVRVPLAAAIGRRTATSSPSIRRMTYPKIKPLFGIDDARVLRPPKMMELARWMSRYYCAAGHGDGERHPVGGEEADRAGLSQMVRIGAKPREELQAILGKDQGAQTPRDPRAGCCSCPNGEAIELIASPAKRGRPAPTVRKLARGSALITITPEIDLPGLTADVQPLGGHREPKTTALNEDQQKVFDELVAARHRAAGFQRQSAARRHRQRQDRSLSPVHPRGGRARQAGDRAGAGDRADAADRAAIHAAFPARRDSAQRAERNRAASLLAADHAGQARCGRRRALGDLRAGAEPGHDRRR